MNLATYSGLLGFLLSLSALNIPVAQAADQVQPDTSVEGRLHRITAAIRDREAQLQDPANPGEQLLIAIGFGNGSRGGSFNQGARWGTTTGPGGGSFNNFHGGYGGAGWRDGGGFVNGSSGGGGFVNGPVGGAGFVNGASGGGGFVNGRYGGGAFRNW